MCCGGIRNCRPGRPSHTLNGDSNGFNCCGNIPLRRPHLDVRERRTRHGLQVNPIRRSMFQNCGKRVRISAPINKFLRTGATRSRAAPTWSLAATGQPQHIASFTTTANGSYSEGRTIRSEEYIRREAATDSRSQENELAERCPEHLPADSSSARSGPSPANTRSAFKRFAFRERPQQIATAASTAGAWHKTESRPYPKLDAPQPVRAAARSTLATIHSSTNRCPRCKA